MRGAKSIGRSSSNANTISKGNALGTCSDRTPPTRRQWRVRHENADILIHGHPEWPTNSARTEEGLSGSGGVVSAHFSPGCPHDLTVAYDPWSITSERILELVRK